MFTNYKKKYQEAKEREILLVEEIEMLKKERAELRWQNENLRIEVRRVNKMKDRVYEAGCIIAKGFIELKGTQKG